MRQDTKIPRAMQAKKDRKGINFAGGAAGRGEFAARVRKKTWGRESLWSHDPRR